MSKRSSDKLLPGIFRCSRLVIVFLIIASFAFVPFHVLTETHTRVDFAQAYPHDDADTGGDHQDDGGTHHVPHPASDHSINALTSGKIAKAKLHTVALVCVFLTPQEISTEPHLTFNRFPLKTEIPPNELLPSPRQPRAPPLV